MAICDTKVEQAVRDDPTGRSRAASDAKPTTPDAQPEALTVFYDGACPLCTREIGFYKTRRGADAISWIDVSNASPGEVAPGLTKDEALARFHVMKPEGTLVSNGRAFAELWAALPGYRLIGRIAKTAPIAWFLDRAYSGFLRLRPRLQSLVAPRHAGNHTAMPAWLLRDLRSDHAGEVGAVAIYQGILAVSRDSDLRHFAQEHLESERQHLEVIEALLPLRSRSIFVPLWRIAGFLTGELPAFFGPAAVYATIDAVETFVDHHYAEQIDRLSRERQYAEVRTQLERCRLDEVRHRDEARGLLHDQPGAMRRAWCWLVGAGSASAVAVARRL